MLEQTKGHIKNIERTNSCKNIKKLNGRIADNRDISIISSISKSKTNSMMLFPQLTHSRLSGAQPKYSKRMKNSKHLDCSKWRKTLVVFSLSFPFGVIMYIFMHCKENNRTTIFYYIAQASSVFDQITNLLIYTHVSQYPITAADSKLTIQHGCIHMHQMPQHPC